MTPLEIAHIIRVEHKPDDEDIDAFVIRRFPDELAKTVMTALKLLILKPLEGNPLLIERPDGWYVEVITGESVCSAGPMSKAMAEQVLLETAREMAPDKNCITLPNGDCVGTAGCTISSVAARKNWPQVFPPRSHLRDEKRGRPRAPSKMAAPLEQTGGADRRKTQEPRMGNVINLDHYREPNSGNGAVPVVREYFDKRPGMPPLPERLNLHRGDQFLGWLWAQGFKVVPLNSVDG